MTMILIRLVDNRILKYFFRWITDLCSVCIFNLICSSVLISQLADLAAHNLEDPSYFGQSTSSQSSLYFSTRSLRWIQNLSLPQWSYG